MIKLPGKNVDIKDYSKVKCEQVYVNTLEKFTIVVINTKQKLWSVISHNGTDIDGIVNGYGLLADQVGYSLAELGMWSMKEASDFQDQQWEARREQEKEAEIKRAYSIFAKYGIDKLG